MQGYCVARLLAKEDERARQEGTTAARPPQRPAVEIEEVFYSGGRHSSQAAVRVRGLGADDGDDEEDDLALDLR